MMTDYDHHGKGQHDQGDMAVPAVPRARLVVIEAKLVLPGFEAVLDRPTVTLHLHECFHGRALRTPCREECKAAIGNVSADQRASDPDAGKGIVIVSGIENGQFDPGPFIPALSPGARASRQALQGIRGQVRSDILCGSGNGIGIAPGDIAEPIDAVRRYLGKRTRENDTSAASARSIMARAIAGLVAKPSSCGT